MTITTAAVLVVIAHADLRELVGSFVAQMGLTPVLAPSWRAAITETPGVPACIVANLNDVGDKTAGVSVLRKSWGGVP